MDLVSSILSTLSFPNLSILAPLPSSSPASTPSAPPQQSDALCGGCPPNGYAPQGSSLWPSQPTGVGGVVWPAQPTQPPPCWYGQPDAPCWPGTQPILAPAPAPAQAPAQAPSPAPATGPVQPCQQPCWPGPQYQPPQYQPPQPQPPQYQPPQPQPPQYQPSQPPQPQPSLPTAPALAPSTQPPRWPATPSWSYNPGQPGWPGQNPQLSPQQWPVPSPAGPLNVPYNLNLDRGVYNKMLMTIMGNVKPDARMFTINFLRGNDIAFHMNPRFNDGGKQVLVRNHKVGEHWGKEERELKAGFPFALGSPFEMKILCTSDEFRVKINNIPLFEFKHRVRELNQINRINILHDVVLTFITVETLP